MTFKTGDLIWHILPKRTLSNGTSLGIRKRAGVIVFVGDEYLTIKTNVGTCRFNLDGLAVPKMLGHIKHRAGG